MRNLSIMIKPASSECNMRCGYCFYSDIAACREKRSHGIMREEMMDRLLRTVRSAVDVGDTVLFAFQGGEPTLAGIAWMEKFFSRVEQWDSGIKVNYALQTNGLLLDDKWCQLLRDHHVLTGISLDLPRSCHDDVRVDAAGRGTYSRVVGAIKLLEQYGVEYNVLCTLTAQVANLPKQVWKEIIRLDLQYVQFTPCLGSLNDDTRNEYELTPGRYASFYNQLFQMWLTDWQKGKYRSIKLFDDVINLAAFGQKNACGLTGSCMPQIVVEADGSVYPCDFYCTDEWRLGCIADMSIEELIGSSKRDRFYRREHRQPTLCRDCRFNNFCGGGCKRMQKQTCCSGGETYCGYQAFLNKNIAEITKIASQQRKLRRQILERQLDPRNPEKMV